MCKLIHNSELIILSSYRFLIILVFIDLDYKSFWYEKVEVESLQGKVLELQSDLSAAQNKVTGSADAISSEIKVLEEVCRHILSLDVILLSMLYHLSS